MTPLAPPNPKLPMYDPNTRTESLADEMRRAEIQRQQELAAALCWGGQGDA